MENKHSDMKETRHEESLIGTLHFFGEDFFLVNLKNIPRERKMSDLVVDIIQQKDIQEKERKLINPQILEKAPEFSEKNSILFFFHPRPKESKDSFLSEILGFYEKYEIKGDPVSTAFMNLLDKDNSFAEKYPHMSLFESGKDLYCIANYVSKIKYMEGFNISTTAVSRLSGYFPNQFWFCGIRQDIS